MRKRNKIVYVVVVVFLFVGGLFAQNAPKVQIDPVTKASAKAALNEYFGQRRARAKRKAPVVRTKTQTPAAVTTVPTSQPLMNPGFQTVPSQPTKIEVVGIPSWPVAQPWISPDQMTALIIAVYIVAIAIAVFFVGAIIWLYNHYVAAPAAQPAITNQNVQVNEDDEDLGATDAIALMAVGQNQDLIEIVNRQLSTIDRLVARTNRPEVTNYFDVSEGATFYNNSNTANGRITFDEGKPSVKVSETAEPASSKNGAAVGANN